MLRCGFQSDTFSNLAIVRHLGTEEHWNTQLATTRLTAPITTFQAAHSHIERLEPRLTSRSYSHPPLTALHPLHTNHRIKMPELSLASTQPISRPGCQFLSV